jgi:hypothetical protein
VLMAPSKTSPKRGNAQQRRQLQITVKMRHERSREEQQKIDPDRPAERQPPCRSNVVFLVAIRVLNQGLF